MFVDYLSPSWLIALNCPPPTLNFCLSSAQLQTILILRLLSTPESTFLIQRLAFSHAAHTFVAADYFFVKKLTLRKQVIRLSLLEGYGHR